MSATETTNDMQTVIERLRASKEEYEDREFSCGKEDGHKWAMKHADYEELRALANDKYLMHEGGENRAARLFKVLNIDDPDDFANVLGYYDQDFEFTDPYVFGFVLGATAVWTEVKDRI